MAEIKFSQLTTAAQLTNDDIFALAQMQGGSLSSVKTSMIAVANFLNTQVQYTTAYNTQAKTTAGAINELKQLISLIPQFAIEVVEELPTEDISDTTIYLVPAEDPEVGNYYEEYIHVNDSWELVGTTAVDLSAYYTKLEVDGLLATKASVTEVALKENKSDMPTDVRTIIKDCKTPKNATITNGIAQFECIEENLVKALKVTMNPIQDLHGYSNPWAGGAWINKLNLADMSGSENNYYFQFATGYALTAGQTYTFSADITSSVEPFNFSIGVGDTSYALDIAGNNNLMNGRKTMTFTPTEAQLSGRPNMFLRVPRYGQLTNFTYSVKNIQLELGSTAHDFAPYENICPISGRTEASVKRTGKNTAPKGTSGSKNNVQFTVADNGSVSTSGTANGSASYTLSSVLLKANMPCIISGCPSGGGSGKFGLGIYKDSWLATDFGSGASYTPTEDITVDLSIRYWYNQNMADKTFYPQIELGSTATAYEPYTAETHTHQYSETIYGGVDDFVNGGATSTYKAIDLGDMTFTYRTDGSSVNPNYFLVTPKQTDHKPVADNEINYICSCYKSAKYYDFSRENLDGSILFSGAYNNLVIIDTRYTDAASIKTALAGQTLCYELATPTTISTSAEEITTVSGTNIISGAEPISECKYTELATVDDLIKIIGGQ